MKKILNFSALFIVLVIALFAYSCGNDSEAENTNANNVCQHRDADDDNLCDKCKEAYTDGKDINDLPSHTHSYTMKRVNSTYLASEATCTTSAQYYYSCECGSADHSSTFEHGEKSAHSYKDMVCTICKSPYYSEGLNYIFDSKTATYSVAGIGNCNDRFISIPSTYNGYPVVEILNNAFSSTFLTGIIIPEGITHIREGAFYNCTYITDVKLPQSLISVEEAAFSGCESLTSITIPFVGATRNGSNNTHFGYIFGASSYSDNNDYIPATLKKVIITGGNSIDSDAFYDCDSLTSVVIPDSVTTIGDSAFSGCKSLTSVTIGNGVTSIGDWAFSYCDSLTSVVIPDSVTIIGEYAFYSCDSLTSVTIGNNVTTIGDSAFSGCKSLTSVTIPKGATIISNSAFYWCTSLTSVTIPDSVTTIGSDAFAWCSSLTSIKYRGTKAQWNAISKGSGWISNIGNNCTITYNYEGE